MALTGERGQRWCWYGLSGTVGALDLFSVRWDGDQLPSQKKSHSQVITPPYSAAPLIPTVEMQVGYHSQFPKLCAARRHGVPRSHVSELFQWPDFFPVGVWGSLIIKWNSPLPAAWRVIYQLGARTKMVSQTSNPFSQSLKCSDEWITEFRGKWDKESYIWNMKLWFFFFFFLQG